MPAPFTLDVDAAAVGRFGTHVGELATELRAKGERAAQTSARPAVAAWEGDAASSVKPEMTGLGNLLCRYSNDLVTLSEAVGRFVTAIGTAEEELAALDTAWRRADEVHADAVADAGSAHTSALREAGRDGAELDQGTEQRLRGLHAGALREAAGTLRSTRDGLEADFGEIRARVARAARALSASLVATTPIDVPAVALAEWQADGTVPSYDFDPGLLLFGLGVTRDLRAQENPTADLELRLREEGLLTGPAPSGAYLTWLENAVENGVEVDVVVEIAEDHDLTPASFDVLDGLEAVTDRDGKTFYLLPSDLSGDDARRATMLTYVLNAGTGYGDADGSEHNDFDETPYSSAELQRILDRQAANDWSYDDDVDFVHGNGGRLATTPNGMMMGLGGNWLQDRFSLNGGTAWGDIFMLNIDSPSGEDAAQALRETIASGRATYEDDDGGLRHGSLDLDRLLHHEEIHSQQWAEHGHAGFIARYLASAAWNLGDATEMGFEQDAGLSDGGYE